MWKGDSIQFSVAPGTPKAGSESYQNGMALTPDGPQLVTWIAPSGVPTGAVTNANLHVTRDDASGTTTYKLAIPWSDLQPVTPSADQIFSLSILVNDNDGNGRKGWMEWGSGIGFGQNPAEFNEVQLVS